MKAKIIALIPVILLLLINLSFAEILVQTAATADNSSVPGSQAPSVSQPIIVNMYYPATSTVQPSPQQQVSILIQQKISEAKINRCEKANFSFQIYNPSTEQQIYSFKVNDFTGTAYITPNLLLQSQESKIVQFTLVPDCSLAGDLNPVVHVETQAGDEQADAPVIIHVLPGVYYDESSCQYYYNSTICNSPLYIRFNQGTTYQLDLSQWFYDPDGDTLAFSVKQPVNLKIDFKGSTAKITPEADWFGTEEVVFYAQDNKGGQATSASFYIHVLQHKNQGFSISNFFSNIFK